MPLVNLSALVPTSLRGYQKSWLRTDLIAGVTLAAVAIPETMGYTSIAQTPIVTGLYTVIFPTRCSRCSARPACWWWGPTPPRRRSWPQGWPPSAWPG